jgi:hypothetical protein
MATMSWVRERRRVRVEITIGKLRWWPVILGLACFSLGASGLLEHVVAWLR